MEEYTSLEQAIRSVSGERVAIRKRIPASGGDINRACVLELTDGNRVFMKENRRENIDFFRAEAEGLAAIRETGMARAPEVLALGMDGNNAFLLLEHIEAGARERSSMEELGASLAKMHLADTACFTPGGRYGFHSDNYIGASPQGNSPMDKWTDFFVQRRLRPQFAKALSWFEKADRRRIDRLLERIDTYIPEPERPSLLHGDLWAGIDPGYRDRRDLYNLYHLLNHLNLFGGGYLSSVRVVLRRYV